MSMTRSAILFASLASASLVSVAEEAATEAAPVSYSAAAISANRSLFTLRTEAEKMKARADVAEAASRMNKTGVFVDENGTINGGGGYVATFGTPEPAAGVPGAPGVPGMPGMSDPLAAPAAPVDSTPKLQSITGDRAFFQIAGRGVVQARVGETLPGGYKVVGLDNGATLERGGTKTVVNIEWGIAAEDRPKNDPLSSIPGRR